MAIDTRDYYKDKHNQAAGYRERSPLRQSMAQVKAERRARIRARRAQSDRQSWHGFLFKLVAFIVAIVVLLKLAKPLMA